jgi:hypothetical protein
LKAINKELNPENEVLGDIMFKAVNKELNPDNAALFFSRTKFTCAHFNNRLIILILTVPIALEDFSL